jgi:hypothetical protein
VRCKEHVPFTRLLFDALFSRLTALSGQARHPSRAAQLSDPAMSALPVRCGVFDVAQDSIVTVLDVKTRERTWRLEYKIGNSTITATPQYSHKT